MGIEGSFIYSRTDGSNQQGEFVNRTHLEDRYPLDVKSVGEDEYIVMSKGHHDPHEFMKAVRERYKTWPLGFPTQEWTRAVPTRMEGYKCVYVDAKPHSRGAFPSTYTREAYREELYENVVSKTDEVTK